MVKRKRCLRCQINYFNFLYPKNRLTYQREDDLGTCKVCYFCQYKVMSKNMSTWHRKPGESFRKVVFKNKLEIIKHLLT